jgi:hypothetical protein
MWVDVCTNPSKFSKFESWGWIRAVFVHAHEITVAGARVMSLALLAHIQEIKKLLAILKVHTGPELPCSYLSAGVSTAMIIYFS